MERRARAARSWAAVAAALAMLLTGAVACTGDDEQSPGEGQEPGATVAGRESEPINTTVEEVSGSLDEAKREEVKADVSAVVDGWFEGAFLGEFPREDYAPAFTAFTDGARKDAMRDLDLMSNQKIEDQIGAAVAGNRRVRLDVLAPKGQAQGATARFVLDFFTEGELEDHLRVKGALYLTKQEGEWRVFGYDVYETQSRGRGRR